jgi:hypothetical protein
MRLSFALTLAGLAALVAACASDPGTGSTPPPINRGCAVDMPAYPPCEPVPMLVPDPYYPAYGYPYYPGTGVIIVPEPFPVPVTPPPRPPVPPVKPPKPPKPPKHVRPPRPKPCHPKPGTVCP